MHALHTLHYFCHHYYTVYIGLKDKKCLERGLRHYLKLHGIHQRITYTAAQVKTTVMRILKKCPNEIEPTTLPQQPKTPETPAPKTPVVGGADGGDALDDNTDPGSIDDSTIGPNDDSTIGGSTGGSSGGSREEPNNTDKAQQGNGTDSNGNGGSQQGKDTTAPDTVTGATGESSKSDPPVGHGDSPRAPPSDTPAPAPLLEVPATEPICPTTFPTVEPPVDDTTVPPVDAPTPTPSIVPDPHATTPVAVEVVESGSSSSSGSGSAVDPKPEQPAVVPPSVVTPVVTVTPVTELNQSTDTAVIDTTSTTMNTNAEQQRVDGNSPLAVGSVDVVDTPHNASTATVEQKESDSPRDGDIPNDKVDSPTSATEPTATPSPVSSGPTKQQNKPTRCNS
jgi:hypothetical protein